jgi:signal transduction histidine kinase
VSKLSLPADKVVAMPTGLRKTGISVIGDMHWGTHFCHFHETKQDLLDTLIPYFKAGLEDNEFCLWVISKLLTEEDAWSALRQAVPDLDRYLAERSIEILPHDEWYLRRKGDWEAVETPELKQAKAEIKRLNEELEQRVIERTRELAAINEELRREIRERKRLEEALRATSEHLRALSASLRSAREEEGARIARELHDELGSALTSLKWDLEDIGKLYLEAGNQTGSPILREKIEGMMGLIDATINTVRRISSELRPSILDDLGLVAAIEWQAQQFEARTGIICQFDSFVDTTDLSREHATAIFRIFQEALTNIRRHAQATRVNIMIEEEEGEFVLEVRDNGRGIAEDESIGSRSLGLMGMRERAQLVGGRIEITGVAGKGTVLTVRVPIPSQASDSSTLIGQRGSY